MAFWQIDRKTVWWWYMGLFKYKARSMSWPPNDECLCISEWKLSKTVMHSHQFVTFLLICNFRLLSIWLLYNPSYVWYGIMKHLNALLMVFYTPQLIWRKWHSVLFSWSFFKLKKPNHTASQLSHFNALTVHS